MKIQFVCPTSYTIGNKTYKLGDIIEEDAEKLLKSFPYLFKQIIGKPVEVEVKPVPRIVDMSQTKADLQKIARSFNIKVKDRWTKQVLIDKINSLQNT